jgi:hypothetical protein
MVMLLLYKYHFLLTVYVQPRSCILRQIILLSESYVSEMIADLIHFIVCLSCLIISDTNIFDK